MTRRLCDVGRSVPWAVAAACMFLASCDTATYRVAIDAPSASLTEVVAIQASREALAMAGYDAATLEPVCYRNCEEDEPYLARASKEAVEGYILWRFTKRTDALYHLSVRVRIVGDHLQCSVSQAK